MKNKKKLIRKYISALIENILVIFVLESILMLENEVLQLYHNKYINRFCRSSLSKKLKNIKINNEIKMNDDD